MAETGDAENFQLNYRAMSLIKTERLFEDGDVNTQQILMMIDKGIKKNLTRIMTDEGQKARKLYKTLKPFQYAAFIVMIFLAFFEKPDWCLRNDVVKDYVYCTPPQGGPNPRNFPPTSGFPYMSPLAS